MQPGKRTSLLFKIALPILFLWLLKVAPLPHQFSVSMREARQAQADGYHQLAAARMRLALSVNPQRSELWEQIGREEMAAGREPQALQALRAAQSAGALSAQGALLLGDLFARQGDTQSALATWQAQQAKSGPSAELYQRQAQLLEVQDDEAALVAVYRGWHELEPSNARVSYALGLRLAVQSPQEALQLLMEAARLDASLDERVQVLRRGINQASTAENSGYGWVMVGRALARLEEWTLARRAFEQATQASPEYAEAWAFLAEARYQTGESGEAALVTAHTLNHHSPLVQAVTAIHWRRQGRMEEALSYLQEVARQEPSEFTWQIELGNLLAETGDLEAALQSYRQATRLAPNNILPWLALARFSLLYNYDLRNVGLVAARQALVIAPDRPEGLDMMGLVLLYLDDISSAERFLQRAIEQDTTYADAYLHLGQLYLQQQDHSQAQIHLRQALQYGQDRPAGSIAQRLLQQYFSEGGLP
jgi:tetratricopeptide (TPR) repeat protein